jgi:hypothetical protein
VVIDLPALRLARTGTRHNADHIPGARDTKSFNTLTAAFEAARSGLSIPPTPSC